MTKTFTTVITQEGSWYIARCVELGVVTQGKNLEAAQKNLKEAVELYLEDVPKTKWLRSKTAPMVTTMQINYG